MPYDSVKGRIYKSCCILMLYAYGYEDGLWSRKQLHAHLGKDWILHEAMRDWTDIEFFQFLSTDPFLGPFRQILFTPHLFCPHQTYFMILKIFPRLTCFHAQSQSWSDTQVAFAVFIMSDPHQLQIAIHLHGKQHQYEIMGLIALGQICQAW